MTAGHRVVTYDRRGFGKSSQPSSGYNYDIFAEDLHQLISQLQLRNFALVGFSMGGGEVARYIGMYGSQAVTKAVMIGGVPPYLLKTADNPEGVDGSVFEAIKKAVAADRYAFFSEFFKNFYNTDVFLGTRVSEQTIQASWNIAAGASPTASFACVGTWHEDFRQNVAKIDIPTLVIHGDADRIVPHGRIRGRRGRIADERGRRSPLPDAGAADERRGQRVRICASQGQNAGGHLLADQQAGVVAESMIFTFTFLRAPSPRMALQLG